MLNQKKLIVSHAPFWHNGSCVAERYQQIIIALLPAVFMGLVYFGVHAMGVICLSVSTAIGWEILFCLVSKRPITVNDGNAALTGLLFGMLLPATAPWWLVLTGTFVAIVLGKQIFGGIGSNPFCPAALSFAILMVSWKTYFDFDAQLIHYDFNFTPFYPLAALKAFGPQAIEEIQLIDLLVGKQVGGAGSTCALALMLGGAYLILRGVVRWEIPVSFIAGLGFTALMFHIAAPHQYAGPLFHLFTGFSMIGIFFLATDDSASPVNTIPMLIYGATGGVMTILIRNLGQYTDGVIFAVLLINLINPLIDKIRPKAIGKVT